MRSALLVMLLVVLMAPAAARAACDPHGLIGNTNGDDDADIATGNPGSGRVYVSEGFVPQPTVITGEPTFGSALALADVDADGCSDLLAGTPASARVDVFAGDPGGLAPTAAASVGSPAGVGDDFGAAIAVSHRGAFGTARDLWVGAPGTDVDGVPDAGAVFHYVLQPPAAPVLVDRLTALPGPTAGERFGTVLAPARLGAYVGAPQAKDGAGAVYRLNVQGNGAAAVAGREGGAPGAAFGAAVAADPRSSVVVIGAPNALKGRGGVAVSTTRRFGAGRFASFVPGRGGLKGLGKRQRAHFGAAVVAGLRLTSCPGGRRAFAVGSPGRRVHGRRAAGMVSVIPIDGMSCSRSIAGEPGEVEVQPFRPGTRLGGALGLLRTHDDYGRFDYDDVAAAMPGAGVVVTDNGTSGVDAGAPGRIVLAVPQSGPAS